jgi:peptidyl-prolyl cis-trans isomerase SurA
MKILAVLLCTAALGGCSLFSSKKKAEPVAAAAPAATNASNAAPAAPAKPKADGAGFLPPGESGNVAIDSIVVVVNDDVITQRELANRIKTVTARMKAQNVAMPEAADLRRQLLERMIVERSQLQMAKEMGVRVDDLQLDRAIARIAEAQKLSVQDLRNQMEKDGTPFASFREEIREEIIMQRLREHEVDAKLQISEAEVDSFRGG